MNDYPTRKNIRLTGYDYSAAGYYFVTICVTDHKELLGQIVGTNRLDESPGKNVGETVRYENVRGTISRQLPLGSPGLLKIELTELGLLVDSAIRFYIANNIVTIDKYVIMPNHIHMIIVLQPETGDRGRPPLPNIIRAFKAYISKQIGFSPWQRSYHDRVIRGEAEYRRLWQYIEENPARWAEDEYHV